MNENGQLRDAAADAGILRWPGGVLSADDLRRSLNGQREVRLAPRAVVTPLAWEHLRQNGVALKREEAEPQPPTPTGLWGYAQDRPHPGVESAVQSLKREGLLLSELTAAGEPSLCRWARGVSQCVARGDCRGGVVFCQDPALVCCVANKLAGLRAAAVSSVAQATRAALSLGANFLVVEMPGRTFFEVRQILRTIVANGLSPCPAAVGDILKELDGHAHR
jgi:ribose 5-phosphate isomerase RpiB